MDPLSDILSLLKLRSYASGGCESGGDWSIRFCTHPGVKCYAVVSGEFWLLVDSVHEAIHIKGGDCFIPLEGWPFRLTSDLSLAPVDALAISPAVKNGWVTCYKAAKDFLSVARHFALTCEQASMLSGLLPPIVHIADESDKALLKWCVEGMRQALRHPQPGSFLVAQQPATMLLVQALWIHLAECQKGDVGSLFALADKRMATAMFAKHSQPARPWTLQLLAERAGTPRTIFALKFKESVGQSPLDYRTRWWMLLAGDRLENSNLSLSAIEEGVGYESDSAFSMAFKRVMGCTPGQYASRPGLEVLSKSSS